MSKFIGKYPASLKFKNKICPECGKEFAAHQVITYCLAECPDKAAKRAGHKGNPIEIDYTEYLCAVEEHNRNLQAEIERLKDQLTRAADALEGHLPACHKDAWLVNELREAAK